MPLIVKNPVCYIYFKNRTIPHCNLSCSFTPLKTISALNWNRKAATHCYFSYSLPCSHTLTFVVHTYLQTVNPQTDGRVLDDTCPLPPVLSDITYQPRLWWSRKGETQFHLISPSYAALSFILHVSVSALPPDLLHQRSPLTLSLCFTPLLVFLFSFCHHFLRLCLKLWSF